MARYEAGRMDTNGCPPDGWRSLHCFLIFLLTILQKWVPHPLAVFKRVR